MYDIGHGTAKDKVLACKYYQLASEQGYATAQCNLAYMYDNGYGVRQDKAQAFKFYFLAAEQGAPRAHCNLAEIYAKGEPNVVKKDERLATKHYHLAAVQDYERAQKYLNKIYKGEENSTLEVLAITFLAEEWPKTQILIHHQCQKTILEIFYIFFKNHTNNGHVPQIPIELVFELAKALILVWPEKHYLMYYSTSEEKRKRQTTKQQTG